MNTAGIIAVTHFEPSHGTIGRPAQTPDLFSLDGSTEFRWQVADQEEALWAPDSVTEIREWDSNNVEYDPDKHYPS